MWLLLTVAASAAEPSVRDLTFFEEKIRPILSRSCYSCHSDREGKTKGGLALDSRERIQQGGNSGPLFVAGSPDESLLVKAVRYDDEELQMPPKGKKLSRRDIGLLETWVEMGCPHPRSTGPMVTAALRRARGHWAFQPIQRPSPPQVANHAWVKTPIDAFILAKQVQKRLSPNPAADKRTLIRRANFDLIGLPPSMDSFDAFMADGSDDAFAKVVDRLLDSKSYGERWGRYWLDVARYADTKGPVNNRREDTRFPYAWTYRDYVIDAFNDDKPFDRFILEQIAGDQLKGASVKDMAGLGFLTVGKRYNNDSDEVINYRIDVVTKGFLGLTVTCARCHDHKFDPIPTADYYSLHGVFSSVVEPNELPLINPKDNSRELRDFLRRYPKEAGEARAIVETRLGGLRKQARERASDYMIAAIEIPKERGSARRNAESRGLNYAIYQKWVRFMEVRKAVKDPVLAPWFVMGPLNNATFERSARAPTAAFARNAYPGQTVNPLVAKLLQRGTPQSRQQLASWYQGLFVQAAKYWGETIAIAQKRRTAKPLGLGNPHWEEIRRIIYAPGSPASPSDLDLIQAIDDRKQQRDLVKKEGEIIDYLWKHPGTPGRAMILVDSPMPRDSKIYVRGDANDQGAVAPRRFLEALSPPGRKPFQHGSGRLELARAIADPENPLTARVIVNRVWMAHFGEGLVRSVDDFGSRAELPSHPELLDWLATWFIDNGWSIKRLHRLIMLSNVYLQSSADNPRHAQIDPGNHLLWRMNVRRLEFEALRDSLLAIGGRLDTRMGGPPVDLTAYPYARRRTVYGEVDRGKLASVFTTFDFANPDFPTGKRYETTVPQQALYLMNNQLVIEQSKMLVAHPEFRELKTDAARMTHLYKLIYQRKPTRMEFQLASKYLIGQNNLITMQFNNPIWQYGYGGLDYTTRKTTAFAHLPHFRKDTWFDASRKQGPLSLNATGGQPGLIPGIAAIRRWTAPVSGAVTIKGALIHKEELGDGVVGRIVHSEQGEIKRVIAHNTVRPTFLDVVVNKGDTLDFMVDCRRIARADHFEWAPDISISFKAAGMKTLGIGEKWSAEKDFSGPKTTARAMASWERYAQVLLLTNELTFYH